MSQVMVCDDDERVLKMMATILTKAGHSVVTCACGAEALSRLGIAPEEADIEPPDLLVLDIMMPKTDGYAIGAILREHPRTREIPILAVSALPLLSRLFTSAVRVDGFLSKPFAPEALVASAAKVLEGRQART
jgi:CheY-like chemotaxis protein